MFEMPDSVRSMKMNMKNFLKKLHITPNPPDEAASDDGSSIPTTNNKSIDVSSPSPPPPDSSSRSQTTPELKPFSGLSNWLSSVGHRKSPSPPDSFNAAKNTDAADNGGDDPPLVEQQQQDSKDPEVEEEYQIQLALELSAREDPEAAQIEAMKQFTLGSSAPDNNSPAELVAYRYWVMSLIHKVNSFSFVFY